MPTYTNTYLLTFTSPRISDNTIKNGITDLLSMNSISSIPNIFYKLAAVKQRKPIDPAFCVVVDAVFMF